MSHNVTIGGRVMCLISFVVSGQILPTISSANKYTNCQNRKLTYSTLRTKICERVNKVNGK